jgi:iron complex outermembrane receptor protein
VRQIYSQAESDYETGRVEQALSTLQANIAIFKGNLQQSAYRLMALCLLSLDENEKAEDCTRRLLDYDPYFTPSSQDPQRFIDMVENIKLGLTAKITTASSQAESLDEVPVPTTLITEEMIHNCGGMNLQEVLAAYVPGMNIVDCNDDINIAMRGIYSNGQEKILFMLNGHRLNNYSTNIAAPDYSISLEKVKQIEVLRGPASSLYGGVALTAVVNIITKQGADVDGVMIKGGIGNYHQMRGDLLFGKRYFDLDLLIWGSIYGNKGQTMDAPPEMAGDDYGIPFPTVSINHIGEKPSFDFGVQMKYKNLQFLYNTHFSQKIPPYSMSTMAKSYDHDKYMQLNGFSPSFSSKSHHSDLSYSRSLGKVNLKGTVTYDNSELSHYQIVTDFPFPELGSYYGIPDSLNFFNYPGIFRFLSADEKDANVTYATENGYINAGTMDGEPAFVIKVSDISRQSYPGLWKTIDTRTDRNMDTELGSQNAGSVRPYVIAKFSEFYFIAAEAAVKGAKTTAGNTARDLINVIRARAGKWTYSVGYNCAKVEDHSEELTAATPAEITIDYIMDERLREYFGEGYRWYDLVRTQTWEKFAGVYHIADGNGRQAVEKVRDIQKNFYLRPIPNTQIDAMIMTKQQKAAYQNPGY